MSVSLHAPYVRAGLHPVGEEGEHGGSPPIQLLACFPSKGRERNKRRRKERKRGGAIGRERALGVDYIPTLSIHMIDSIIYTYYDT